MKHQYFGDHRDLFIFDLVLEILPKTGLGQLTYIPMLTRDNDSEYVLRTEAEEAIAAGTFIPYTGYGFNGSPWPRALSA